MTNTLTLPATYEQALDYLYGRINYERATSDSYSSGDFKLERMRELLRRLGDPHLRLPVVHVAGTKGKGSTCSMLAAMLQTAGLTVGLFTSPHLNRFEERLTVNGEQPSPAEIVELLQRIAPVVAEMDAGANPLHPTYFEIATAMGWLHFLDRDADIAVMEVGLGGRLDSTNICAPAVTIITNVSRDHTQILGSTVRQIAAEKAGILKPNVPVISGCTHPDAVTVVREFAERHHAPLWELGREIQVECHPQRATVTVTTPDTCWTDVVIPLLGEHQRSNAALAIAALSRLQSLGWNLPDSAVAEGMLRVHWPGRIEVLASKPTVIVDAAHNWQSVKALVETVLKEFPQTPGRIRQRCLVFATTKDKDYAGQLRQLLPHFETVILTRYADNPRGVPVSELQTLVGTLSNRQAHVANDSITAWKLAKRLSSPDDLIVVTGSFFLLGELRDVILDDRSSGHSI